MIPHPSIWPRRADRLSVVCAVVITLLCAVIMTGWIVHSYALLHLNVPLAAMQFNTTLCFMLYSVAFLCLRRADRFSLGAIAAAMAVAMATLLQYLLNKNIGIDTFFIIPFDVDYNVNQPGRMAASTAFGHLLAGVALLLCLAPGVFTYRRALAITLLGSIVITTGAVPLLGHVLDLKAAYDSGRFVHMSVYAAVFFILLGALIIAHALSRAQDFHNWLPIPVFICITFVTYFMSEAVQQQEEANFDAMMQAEVTHLTQAADLHLTTFYRAIDRIANRWDAAGGTSQHLWEKDAGAYVHDYPFLAGLAITDADARIKWVIPKNETTAKAIGFQITSEPVRAEAFARALSTRQGQTSKFVELLHGGVGYLYVVPLYSNGNYQGVLIAGTRVEQIFNALLKPETLHDFYVTVNEKKQIFSTLPPGQEHLRRWQKSNVIHNKNTLWDVTISPTPQLLATKNSFIPLLLKIVGITIATLATLSIIFMLKWRHNANVLRLRELALEESSRLNDAILAGAAHLIVATDVNGTVLVFNRQAELALGYSADEIIGKQTPALWHDAKEVAQRAQELSRETGQEIKPGFDVFTKKISSGGSEKREWSFIRKDGSVFPGELTASPLKGGSDMQTVGYLGIIQDISERKEIERIKNEFISTVSHELRTPLTSIRGSLGLLLGGVTGTLEDKAKNLAEIAYKNCERLVLLINDILDLEKIEAGQMHFDMKAENLTAIVEQALMLNQSFAEKYGVRFIRKDAPKNARVSVDSGRLTQVMNNLLSNAAKFSPPGSEVEITIAENASSFRVSVTDKGTGIPDEFKSRIFQKFAQADGSDSRQKGGTGLGLTISRTIIEHMGGTIGFTTQTGKGTTFYFDLPQAIKSDAVPITIARNLGNQPRILICEDEPDIAQLLSITLRNEGYACDSAHSAGEALEYLASGARYIAMTLDIMLPDKDGLTFLHELHAAEWTRQLPVIIVSAKAEEVSGKLNGLAVGIVDCLSKPIDTARLIRAVRSVSAKQEKPCILHVEDDEDTVTVLAMALGEVATLVPALSVKDARRLLQEKAFDLIILDVTLPDGSGLDVLTILQQNGSSVPVIIFSAHDVPAEINARVAVSLTKSKHSSDHIVSTILTLIAKMNPGTSV